MTIFEMIFLTSGSINERPSRCHTNILPHTGYIIIHFGMTIQMKIINMKIFLNPRQFIVLTTFKNIDSRGNNQIIDSCDVSTYAFVIHFLF